MPTIADLNVAINANTTQYVMGLQKAGKSTEGFTTKGSSAFSKFGKVASGGLVLVAGAAVGFAAGIAKTIDGIVDTEEALRPMVERSRIGAESLQLLSEAAKRAGSEDGLEAVVDTAQELQLQLGELALTGAARAEDALASLGLQAEKLQAMEPEAAWRAVVAEIQKIPNVADRAIAAEEIFGGTSEKLAGIINLTTAEFAALEAEVVKTSDIWSGEALASAKEFDQEMQNLKTDLARGTNALAAGMLPALTNVVSFIRTTGLPAWQDLKAMAMDPLIAIIKESVVPVFENLIVIGGHVADAFSQDGPMEALWVLNDFMDGKLRGTIEAIYVSMEVLNTFVSETAPAGWETLRAGVEAVREFLVNLDEQLGFNLTNFTLLDELLAIMSAFMQRDFKGAVEVVTGIFDDMRNALSKDVLPVLGEMFEVFRDKIWPLLRDYVIPIFAELIEGRLKIIKVVWDNVVRPALKALTDFLTDTLIPIITDTVIPAIVDFAEAILPKIKEAWDTYVKPALDAMAEILEVVLVTAVATIKDAIRDFSDFFSEFSGGVSESSTSLGEKMTTAFEGVTNFVNEHLGPAFKEIAEFVWPLVVETWEEHLKPTWEAIVAIIRDVIIPWLVENKDIFIGTWEAIKFVVKAIAKSLALIIEGFIGTVSAVIRTVLAIITGDWEGAWQGIKDFFEEWLEFILGMFRAWGLAEVWSGIWEGIKSVWDSIAGPIIKGVEDLLSTIGKVSGAISNIPKLDFGGIGGAIKGVIPGMASGGSVTRGGVVDVHADERIFLPTGAQVQPAGAGGGMGSTYVFNFPNYVGSQDDLRRMINEARLEFERRGN